MKKCCVAFVMMNDEVAEHMRSVTSVVFDVCNAGKDVVHHGEGKDALVRCVVPSNKRGRMPSRCMHCRMCHGGR